MLELVMDPHDLWRRYGRQELEEKDRYFYDDFVFDAVHIRGERLFPQQLEQLPSAIVAKTCL